MKTTESGRAASVLCKLVRQALLPATLLGTVLLGAQAHANEKSRC